MRTTGVVGASEQGDSREVGQGEHTDKRQAAQSSGAQPPLDAREPSADVVGEAPAPSTPAPQRDASDAQDPTLPAKWDALRAALKQSLQREQFETWFRRTALARCDDEHLCITTQNSFSRDWLQKNYLGALEKAVVAAFGKPLRIEFGVDPELLGNTRAKRSAPVAGTSESDAKSRPSEVQAAPATTNRLMWASDVDLNPQYRFDNFVVGPCNRFAYASCVGVSESPGSAYNPFFLHGSVGLGKTHLLQSLCYSLLERSPQMRILYLSCETFVNHFISALENGDLTKFRNKYRNVDVLVVDDIHLLANKERTQEEFFHTFNTLYNAGKQIVLSSDSSPKEIPTLQERLVSRFKWGLVTEIEPACYETRVAILKRKSKARGHELADDVASLLAEHVDTNIRELEGAVTRVLGYASLNGKQVTAELVQHVLRDVFAGQKSHPSMEDILRVVTAHFNVKLSELQSKRRTKAIAHPRQIGMYLLRKTTRHSLEEIGGFFGGRDHSTVLYAVERVESQMRDDVRLRELVSTFLGQLSRSR